MTAEQQYHSIDSPITPDQTMRWVSVNNFENPETVDFRDISSDEEASILLRTVAGDLTKHVLQARKETPPDARPVSNIGKVTSFIGQLGFRANGSILNVTEYRNNDVVVSHMGATSPLRRQAFVIENNIAAPQPSSSNLPELSRQELREYTAIHEAVHLAGVPEIGYFVAHPKFPLWVKDSRFSAPTLRHPTNPKKGGYFEEGFATWIANKYVGQNYPEIAQSEAMETRATHLGKEVKIPIRHSFAPKHYPFMGWGMEQLVEAKPEIWEILIASRQSGATNSQIRAELKPAINSIYDDLYNMLNDVDCENPEQVIALTSLIGIVTSSRSSN